MDLLAMSHPKEATWNQSGQGWLLDIYDWDLIAMEHKAAGILSFGLKLCIGMFPCSIRIKGNPHGVIRSQGGGYISCLSSGGHYVLL